MATHCPMHCELGTMTLEDGSSFTGPIYRIEQVIEDYITEEKTAHVTETPCPYRPLHGVLPGVVPHYTGHPDTWKDFLRLYNVRKENSNRAKQ